MNESACPASEEQVRELLHWALAGNQRLRIQGGGGKAGFGHAVDADCTVSLAELRGVLDYQPEELVMRALPGTPLDEIYAALDRHRQQLAFEPGALTGLYGTGTATIGGTFLGNVSGPRRFRAGAARDHILGVRAVSGRAEAWKSGGQVIKNVTGYDLSKLLAGSWGTLSIVTELTFKVLPAPAAADTIAAAGLAPEAGLALLRQLAGSPLEPGGLAYLPRAGLLPAALPPDADPGAGVVLVRVEGSAISVRERSRALEALLPADATRSRLDAQQGRDAWRQLGEVTPLRDLPVVLRIAAAPAGVAGLFRLLPVESAWYADNAGGWLWIGLPERGAVAMIQTLRAQMAVPGGAAVVFRAPDAVKHAAGVLSPAPAPLARLQQRLRDSFDPRGLLNPGRLQPA